MIRVVSSRIPDPDADFLPSRIPDPGVKKAPNPGSRIRIRNTDGKLTKHGKAVQICPLPPILSGPNPG